MRKFLLVTLMLMLAGNLNVCISDDRTNYKTQENDDTMKIKIIINGNTLSATLNNSAAAKDFASLLPMTLTLDDYAQTEKVSDLGKRLDTNDSPSGFDPDIGDITYYAPWDNLAIFYKDFGYASGLVKLGEIDGDINPFKTSKKIEATFEMTE